jgi:hypothetical protein
MKKVPIFPIILVLALIPGVLGRMRPLSHSKPLRNQRVAAANRRLDDFKNALIHDDSIEGLKQASEDYSPSFGTEIQAINIEAVNQERQVTRLASLLQSFVGDLEGLNRDVLSRISDISKSVNFELFKRNSI